jgi:hypothetical protein
VADKVLVLKEGRVALSGQRDQVLNPGSSLATEALPQDADAGTQQRLPRCLVPLHGGVVAPGVVNPDSNKKTIQHLEGGIIAELPVRDGESVKAGAAVAAGAQGAAGTRSAGLTSSSGRRSCARLRPISSPPSMPSRKCSTRDARLMRRAAILLSASSSCCTGSEAPRRRC